MAVAFWRVTLVALFLAPTVHRVSRGDILRVFEAGLAYTASMVLLFAALQHTAVMRAVALLCLGGVWVALLEWCFHRIQPEKIAVLGASTALCGVVAVLLTAEDLPTLGGDALAILAGMLDAAYLLIGRDVRNRVGVGSFLAIACGAASLVLLPACNLLGVPLFGLPTATWSLIGALAIGPGLIGYCGFLTVLKHLRAAPVAGSLAIGRITVGFAALLLWSEGPSLVAARGAIAVVAGVTVIACGTSAAKVSAPSSPGSAALAPDIGIW